MVVLSMVAEASHPQETPNVSNLIAQNASQAAGEVLVHTHVCDSTMEAFNRPKFCRNGSFICSSDPIATCITSFQISPHLEQLSTLSI